MKKEKLSVLILALELLAITILHSNKLSNESPVLAKDKIEKISPANPNLVLQVKVIK